MVIEDRCRRAQQGPVQRGQTHRLGIGVPFAGKGDGITGHGGKSLRGVEQFKQLPGELGGRVGGRLGAARRGDDLGRAQRRDGKYRQANGNGFEQHQSLGFGPRRESEHIRCGVAIAQAGVAWQVADETDMVLDAQCLGLAPQRGQRGTFTGDHQQQVRVFAARDGGGLKRLTQTLAIDTEPCYSPDGRQIYFVSDRGGGPQVYRVATGGGGVERVTFAGSYNISPAISADGRTLAYVTRQGNSFKLQTLDLSTPGSQPASLTDTSDDESPSFAPNGKLIIYATRAGGRDVLMTTTLDGRIKARLVSTTADVREPTWGPYGR